MSLISSVYSTTPTPLEQAPRRRSRRRRGLTQETVKRFADRAKDRSRLLSLVRANGFPECSIDAATGTMRQYLRERHIKF